MITLRKLETLPESTRGRKLLVLLEPSHDPLYLAGLIRMAVSLLGDRVVPEPTPRELYRLRQRLAAYLGIEMADWDFQAPPDRTGPVTRFPFHVWLDDLRSPFNVGSIIRTAEAYGFSSVSLGPLCPGLDQPRTRRTAMGSEAHVPVATRTLDELQAEWRDRPVFALELGGTPVQAFPFPSEGLVLLGNEEVGLGPKALAWAEGSGGRVSLPLYGRKASLNVGVAFGVLAAAWTSRLAKTVLYP